MTDVLAGNQTVSHLLAFLRGLRAMGLRIGSDEEQLALTAISEVGWESESVCREAVAAVVVKNPVEYPLFVMAWQQFWLLLRRPGDSWVARQTLMSSVMRQKSERHKRPDVIWMGQNQAGRPASEEEAPDNFSVFLKGAQTPDEVLRYKDFSKLTEAEVQELLSFGLHLEPVKQRSLRRTASRQGKTLDLSATLRKNASSKEVLQLVYQKRRTKPRPLVMICDVSGSMDPYSRVMLRFAHALCVNDWDIEVFVFSTRLTRVTRWLEIADGNDALSAVTSNVQHLSGGTRLAQTLRDFHDDYARTVLHTGTIVLLATDGLDTGSTDELETQLGWLCRLSQQLIWLNPLAGHPGYTPTARGAKLLQAYSDHAFPAHNFNALDAAWQRIRGLRQSRPPRRQSGLTER